ncbi:MAG: hypothetical protein AAF798_20765 [Bacteroidota bacterium]
MRYICSFLIILLPISSLSSQALIQISTSKTYKGTIIAQTFSNYDIAAKADTFPPDSSTISIPLVAAPQKTTVRIGPSSPDQYAQFLTLLTFAGDSLHLHVAFDTTRQKPVVTFSGTNAAGHRAYNQFRSKPLIEYLQTGLAAPLPLNGYTEEIINRIKSYTKDLDQLVERQDISQTFHQFATNSIQQSISGHFISTIFNDEDALVYQALPKKDRWALGQFLIDFSTCADGQVFHDEHAARFAIAVLSFKLLQQQQLYSIFELQDTSIILSNNHTIDVGIRFRPILAEQDSFLQEYYLAYYLHFYYKSLIDESVLPLADPLMSYLLEKFPTTKYIDAIIDARELNAMRMEELSNSRTAITEVAVPVQFFERWTPQIISEAGEVKNFSYADADFSFAERLLYIDIWATWCQPCMQEMAYNYQADSLLYSLGVSRVYISIEDPVNRYDEWQQTIDDYHLGGFHVLAGKDLRDWLFKNFGSGNTMQIPRYLLMKNGVVVERFAPSPSRLTELEATVRKYND